MPGRCQGGSCSSRGLAAVPCAPTCLTINLWLLQGSACPRGDACPCAHTIYEYWLHPTRCGTSRSSSHGRRSSSRVDSSSSCRSRAAGYGRLLSMSCGGQRSMCVQQRHSTCTRHPLHSCALPAPAPTPSCSTCAGSAPRCARMVRCATARCAFLLTAQQSCVWGRSHPPRRVPLWSPSASQVPLHQGSSSSSNSGWIRGLQEACRAQLQQAPPPHGSCSTSSSSSSSGSGLQQQPPR